MNDQLASILPDSIKTQLTTEAQIEIQGKF